MLQNMIVTGILIVASVYVVWHVYRMAMNRSGAFGCLACKKCRPSHQGRQLLQIDTQTLDTPDDLSDPSAEFPDKA